MTDPSSYKKGPPTLTNLQLSDSNKDLVLGSRWGLTPRQTGQLTDIRNITLTLTLHGSRFSAIQVYASYVELAILFECKTTSWPCESLCVAFSLMQTKHVLCIHMDHDRTEMKWTGVGLRSCQSLSYSPTYGNWRFITVFTRALQWSLSWARWIQSLPRHPFSLRSIFTLLSLFLKNKRRLMWSPCWLFVSP
jgi:hypothetical protein